MKLSILVTCTHCQEQFFKKKEAIKATILRNGQHFCSLKCSAQYRKHNRSAEESKKLKAAYDEEYRKKNFEKRKAQKAAYFKKTYNPVKAAEHRKTRMPYHVEYCRRPEYREKKQVYDREYRAKLQYGEFWESALLVNEIEKEYDAKQANQDNNTYNKSIKRKRAWLRRQKTDLVRST